MSEQEKSSNWTAAVSPHSLFGKNEKDQLIGLADENEVSTSSHYELNLLWLGGHLHRDSYHAVSGLACTNLWPHPEKERAQVFARGRAHSHHRNGRRIDLEVFGYRGVLDVSIEAFRNFVHGITSTSYYLRKWIQSRKKAFLQEHRHRYALCFPGHLHLHIR